MKRLSFSHTGYLTPTRLRNAETINPERARRSSIITTHLNWAFCASLRTNASQLDKYLIGAREAGERPAFVIGSLSEPASAHTGVVLLLVPADPLRPAGADEHFAPEAAAARDACHDVALIDHDALAEPDGADRAVARVPDGGGAAVYRGWM